MSLNNVDRFTATYTDDLTILVSNKYVNETANVMQFSIYKTEFFG